jgi:Na+/melibiose symporter-like transporter
MSEPKRKSIGMVRMALYGLVNLPTSIVGLPIALYIPAFYSQSLGLSLAAVGSLIALSRLSDVVTDPLIGVTSDRLRNRFGRRKPWMIMGMPLKILALWMLFVPSSDFAVQLWAAMGGEGTSNLYLFVWISFLYLGFTLVDLPYRAWGAELSIDYDERSRVTGWREAFGYGGTLLSLIIPLILAVVYNLTGPANALLGIALVVVILLPALTLPALVWVKEITVRKVATPVSWRRGLSIVWANGPYRRLVFCLVFLVTGVSMTASLSFFFVASVMGESFERYTIFILGYYVSSALAIPMWFWISKRFGKHRTVVLGVAWLSLWSAFIPLMGPGHYWVFFAIMMLKGSAVGALVFLPASMAADVIDLDTLRTGEQRTGLYFSLWGMVNKGGVALGVFLSTNLAAWYGFNPSAEENTEAAKFALACLYSVIPAFLACLSLPLLWNYPLTKKRQQRMRSHIESRDSRRQRKA